MSGGARVDSYECCILGAGPAGFGAALELSRNGVTSLVVIDRNRIVGGLARTEQFGTARFDIGPHRFFTRHQEINALWHATLGSDFRSVRRQTRIYYKQRYFRYPLEPWNAFRNLGPLESSRILLSFLTSQARPSRAASTFEEWVTKKFGRKLYETFFKAYTEKVWGIPCNRIGAEWAAQRIKGLDLVQAVKCALLPSQAGHIRTLAQEFDYPVLGAGQMYEAMRESVEARNTKMMLETCVVACHQRDGRVTAVDVVGADGAMKRITAKQVFSSLPITRFVQLLNPKEPEPVRRAAEALYYREHLTVNLLVDCEELFPDQWIYVHAPDVRMARVANYKNFSRAMLGAGNERKTTLSVEYFAFQHEAIWKQSDDELKALAVDELHYLGLADRRRVEAGWVVREVESYPTYYLGFQEPYKILQTRLREFTNLYPIGRGGLYKYNNQDHATLSGILAARNFLKLPGSPYDVWNLDTDDEYLENGYRTTARA